MLILWHVPSAAITFPDPYTECLEFDDAGNLLMVTRDRIATASTRYRTIGWTLKRENLPIASPENVTVRLKLEENMAPKVDPTDSRYVFSYFYCGRDAIFSKISEASPEWANTLYSVGGYVYLDAINTIVEGDSVKGSMDEAGNFTGEVYETYEGIAGARPWAGGTGLESHFNKKVYFQPVPELVSGKLNLYHMEWTGEDPAEVASLRRYGKDIRDMQLQRLPYHFERADFAEYDFQYEKAAVSIVYYSGETREYAFSAEENGTGDLDIHNEDSAIRSVDIYYYYTRQEHSWKQTLKSVSDVENRMAIRAGPRGNEAFAVKDGIPTGEQLYVEGVCEKYYYDMELENRYGYRSIQVPLRVEGRLSWVDSAGNAHSEAVSVEENFYVDRFYSYWKAGDVRFSWLNQVIVENYAFPEGRVVFGGLLEGDLLLDHRKAENYIILPDIAENLCYDFGTLYGGDQKPEVPWELAQAFAESSAGEIRTVNDTLSIGGQAVLDPEGDYPHGEDLAPPAINASLDLLQENIVILHTKENRPDCPSRGEAIYKNNTEDSLERREIPDINSVSIHTPVACKGKISDDKKFNQKIAPEDNASLILGRYFAIQLGTSGTHREIKGYGSQDYGRYVERRQVCFPFDVYYEETYVRAGTWITVQGTKMAFYLPTGVREGRYEVSYRSIAKNCGAVADGLERGEQRVNLLMEHYVAEDRLPVSVMGRVYGLEVIDVDDYPAWERVFRQDDRMTPRGISYRVGEKDENGKEQGNARYIPLLPGSHPYDSGAGILHTGYSFLFRLKTVGSLYHMEDSVRIRPRFYYISKEGKNRIPVDLYYHRRKGSEQQLFVKAGGSRDQENVRVLSLRDPYSMAPGEDLEKTAALLDMEEENLYKDWGYTFGNLALDSSVRTFSGTTERNVPDSRRAQASIQEWYGEYSLPAEVYAVPRGMNLADFVRTNGGRIDSRSPIFLRDGYIAVNFDIITVNDGQEDLSYINEANAAKGYCNMWSTEGFSYRRADAVGKEYAFSDGDVMLYDLDRSIAGDYRVEGTH